MTAPTETNGLCLTCWRGTHPHDRHTGVAGPKGTDAGCPNLTPQDRECRCTLDAYPAPAPERHCRTCTCGAR